MERSAAFMVTKTYGHNLGLSSCFRQWRADSHCHFMHGYALSFELKFSSDTLNDRNWVIDFGSLKPVKKMLEGMFDHKTAVAKDDPKLELFQKMHDEGLIDMVVVDAVGCEAFAKLVFEWVEDWLSYGENNTRVKLVSVECREHPGNSATYFGGF